MNVHTYVFIPYANGHNLISLDKVIDNSHKFSLLMRAFYSRHNGTHTHSLDSEQWFFLHMKKPEWHEISSETNHCMMVRALSLVLSHRDKAIWCIILVLLYFCCLLRILSLLISICTLYTHTLITHCISGGKEYMELSIWEVSVLNLIAKRFSEPQCFFVKDEEKQERTSVRGVRKGDGNCTISITWFSFMVLE